MMERRDGGETPHVSKRGERVLNCAFWGWGVLHPVQGVAFHLMLWGGNGVLIFVSNGAYAGVNLAWSSGCFETAADGLLLCF